VLPSRSHSSPGDLDSTALRGAARGLAAAAACRRAACGPAGVAACELLGGAMGGRRDGPDASPNPAVDTALPSDDLQACAVHAARHAVLTSGAALEAGGAAAAAAAAAGGGGGGGSGGGGTPALDTRKDSQTDDLSLFEVD